MDVDTGEVEFYHAISPRDGGLGFPKEYFDRLYSKIDLVGLKRIKAAYNSLIDHVNFEYKQMIYLPGYSRDYYINVVVDDIEYTVDLKMIMLKKNDENNHAASDYNAMKNVFSEYCVFPDYEINGRMPTISDIPKKMPEFSFKTEKTEKVTGYRYSVTGSFGYDYYSGNEKIYSISSLVMPNSSVNVYGNNSEWVSDFEECTICPGLSREVRDKNSDCLIAKIVYKDMGEYEINDEVYVYCGTDEYSFVRNEELIAKISSLKIESRNKPDDLTEDHEVYYQAELSYELETEFRML